MREIEQFQVATTETPAETEPVKKKRRTTQKPTLARSKGRKTVAETPSDETIQIKVRKIRTPKAEVATTKPRRRKTTPPAPEVTVKPAEDEVIYAVTPSETSDSANYYQLSDEPSSEAKASWAPETRITPDEQALEAVRDSLADEKTPKVVSLADIDTMPTEDVLEYLKTHDDVSELKEELKRRSDEYEVTVKGIEQLTKGFESGNIAKDVFEIQLEDLHILSERQMRAIEFIKQKIDGLVREKPREAPIPQKSSESDATKQPFSLRKIIGNLFKAFKNIWKNPGPWYKKIDEQKPQ